MEYKIRLVEKSDEAAINEFLRVNFFSCEPLNVAIRQRYDTAFPSQAPHLANCNYINIANGLSVKALDDDGNIVGTAVNTCQLEGLTVTSDIVGHRALIEDIVKFLGLIDEKSGNDQLLAKHNSKVLDIKILTVATEHRKKGIASRLIDEALKIAEHHDMKSVSIGCSSMLTSRIVQHKFPQFKRVLTYPYTLYTDSTGENVFKTAEPHLEYHVYVYER